MTNGGDDSREGNGTLDAHGGPGTDGEADGKESRETQYSEQTKRFTTESDSGDGPGANEADGTAERGQPRTPLGEPTPSVLARERARTSSLDRGNISAYTTDLLSLDSSVQIQWGIRTAIGALIIGFIGSAALGLLGFPPEFGTGIVGVLVVLGVIWVVMSYRVWQYQIREDSVYLERGVVTHVRSIVPYVRIQHVDTQQSPLERALGLSTLVVYTAGSRGADVSIPGLKPEEARDLQQRLKELAIEAEGDDAL